MKCRQVLCTGKEQSKMLFSFTTVVKNQVNLLESKTIFFSEKKMDCLLSHRIFPEEEGKGKCCNLIG